MATVRDNIGDATMVDDVNMWIRESWTTIFQRLVEMSAAQDATVASPNILLYGLFYNPDLRRSKRLTQAWTKIKLFETFVSEHPVHPSYKLGMRPGVLPLAVLVLADSEEASTYYVSSHYVKTSDIMEALTVCTRSV